MPGIGVITNPKAKKNIKRPWIKDSLQRIVGDTGWVYETRSIDELPALAHEFIKKDIEILAINGGDGTTHVTLTNFIPIYREKGVRLPKLLSLRGGTMNTISKSIKHRGKGEDILASVVRKYRNGEEIQHIRQPILKINEKYGFIWGFGIAGNFLEHYYKGTVLGPWRAFKVTAGLIISAIFHTSMAREIFGIHPTVMEVDGRVMEMPDCRALVICSIKEVGLGVKLAYRAYEKPGHVHIRGATLGPFKVVYYVPKIILGKKVGNPGIIDELGRNVRIKTEGNPPYTIDGEMYKDTNEFHVRQGPVLNVIREGRKRLQAGIGLPEDWESRALQAVHTDAGESSSDEGAEQRSLLPENLPMHENQ